MTSHRGAPPKPHRLKSAPGRPSARPAGTVAPTPSPDLPQPAEWLPAGAVPLFQQLVTTLVAMHYASSSYEMVLNLTAVMLWQVAEAARALEDIGHHESLKSGRIRSGLNVATRIAESLLVELGLTPASATRVAVPDPYQGNRFAIFGQDDGADR